jgi:uncharacterized membrane protein
MTESVLTVWQVVNIPTRNHIAFREKSLLPQRQPFRSLPKVFTQPLHMEKSMISTNSVVAVYDTHEQAEHAIKELQEAGVDMKSLSIAARNTHTDEHVVGYYNAGDRMKYWGKMGAFWGGFWGLLFGSAVFAIPGLGPILVAGPLVAWIIAGLEGAVVVGGVSAVGAGLVSIGIPKDSVLKYDVALKTDKFVLVVHGSAEAVDKAKDIIAGTEQSHYAVHGEKVFA